MLIDLWPHYLLLITLHTAYGLRSRSYTIVANLMNSMHRVDFRSRGNDEFPAKMNTLSFFFIHSRSQARAFVIRVSMQLKVLSGILNGKWFSENLFILRKKKSARKSEEYTCGLRVYLILNFRMRISFDIPSKILRSYSSG